MIWLLKKNKVKELVSRPVLSAVSQKMDCFAPKAVYSCTWGGTIVEKERQRQRNEKGNKEKKKILAGCSLFCKARYARVRNIYLVQKQDSIKNCFLCVCERIPWQNCFWNGIAFFSVVAVSKADTRKNPLLPLNPPNAMGRPLKEQSLTTQKQFLSLLL